MPLSFNQSLLRKIELSQTASELVFNGDIELGGLSESSFDTKIAAAFSANTNLNVIVLQSQSTSRLISKILLALKYIKPPIELGISGLHFTECIQIINGLSDLKHVQVLQLINLVPLSCTAITDRLPNAPQIIILEAQDFSLETAQTLARALVRLEGITGLRFYNLRPNVIEEIMKVLPKTKIRMMRVIQPTNGAVDTVQRELLSSKRMYAFDLVRVTTENCISLINAISKSKRIDVLGLTGLSPAACGEVMNRLPQKITLLFVIQLAFEACEVIMEKLSSKSHITEVRLIDLSPDAKIIMLSGLESLGFIASNADPDIFIRESLTATSTLPTSKRKKRDADNAAIADTSTTAKAARSAVQQTFPSSGMASKIAASTSIFRRSTPDKNSAEGSEGHDVDPSQSVKKSREPSPELSFGCYSPENPKTTNADDEPPQRSGEQSPNDFSCD